MKCQNYHRCQCNNVKRITRVSHDISVKLKYYTLNSYS